MTESMVQHHKDRNFELRRLPVDAGRAGQPKSGVVAVFSVTVFLCINLPHIIGDLM